MHRSTGHRSSVLVALMGGTVATALAAGSSAWACSPASSFHAVGAPVATAAAPNQGEVRLVAQYTNVAVGETAVITGEDQTVHLGATTRVVEAEKLITVEATALVPLVDKSTHYFYSFVVGPNGAPKTGSMTSYPYVPKRPASEATTETDPGTSTGTNAGTEPNSGTTANPGTGTEPVGNAAPSPAGAPEGGAAADSGRSSSGARPGTQGGQLGQAPAPATGGSQEGPVAAPSAAPPGAASAATPAGDPAAADPGWLALLPDSGNLWSAVDASGQAASLLDEATPAPAHRGLPTGVLLLGLGVLALAGVGAVAGRRQVVLARRSRS